ncbi:hypothetical protein [Synechococcus sp. PCC 7336]|uniref:hypothetical protein n=1 Tax=Synechococcus sp. PCC 7336 TaxID=195250 RepID=UPI000476791E|nr:hypothetical protein [Synechococcus sp. PCC 7336]
MFVKHTSSGALVEIMSLEGLFDPNINKVMGCLHAGEEMQDAEYFNKSHLTFPSGEPLPQCWVDVNYRAHSQPH